MSTNSYANEVSDCDDAIANNVIYAAKGTALNRPTANDAYFTIWVYAWDNDNITQFASEFGNRMALYCRKKGSSGWGKWKVLIEYSASELT